jgi:hypothetical protein
MSPMNDPKASHTGFRSVAKACASGALLSLAGLGLSGCVAAPPPATTPGYGYTCYAGVYVCRVPAQYPVGAPCSCPGIGAPSYGSVR